MIVYKVIWHVPEFNHDGSFIKTKTEKLFSKIEDAEAFRKELTMYTKKMNWITFTSFIMEVEFE